MDVIIDDDSKVLANLTGSIDIPVIATQDDGTARLGTLRLNDVGFVH